MKTPLLPLNLETGFGVVVGVDAMTDLGSTYGVVDVTGIGKVIGLFVKAGFGLVTGFTSEGKLEVRDCPNTSNGLVASKSNKRDN